MKKFMVLALFATALITFAPSAAPAHPPVDLSASWDAGSQTLSVTAHHGVNDTSKHYILAMSIFDGNKQILMKQYNRQESKDSFSDKVVLKGIKKGTVLRVQLMCNIMGTGEVTCAIN